MAKYVELRRHTDNEADMLTPEGVRAAVEIGSHLAGSYDLLVSTGAQRATQTLAASEQGVFVALGIHPHQAGDDEPLAELRRLLDDSVALGEIGLDFYRDYAPRDEQRRA